MPHKVNFKAVTTGKDPLAQISKRKNVAISESSSSIPPLAPPSKKSRKTTKLAIPKDTPVITEVITETFNPPSPILLPYATIIIPDSTPTLDIVTSGQESPPIIPSSKASSARMVTSSESLTPFLRNCMLKGDIEGIMGYSIPTELHDAFFYFQLKSLKNPGHPRAQAEDLKNKHADLQAVCNGLIKSKSDLSSKHEIDMAVFKSSLEESQLRSRDLRAQLDSSQQLLAASKKQLSIRSPPEVVIEKLKEG
ncbi:hypothetical protein LIER_31739 [Lithospermum erythrorhizon]|uniref:FRIGIDA-like protein n=1 Tax=Lithospermum erythrorhizon TaxID=34254 RepID=A0AAV3RXS6_LITER